MVVCAETDKLEIAKEKRRAIEVLKSLTFFISDIFSVSTYSTFNNLIYKRIMLNTKGFKSLNTTPQVIIAARL